MKFAVFFEDNDDRADQRTAHMAAHLAFLEENAAALSDAGPLVDTADDRPAGGLWLVEADTPDAVRRLVETDPFWPTGLRKSVRILRWNRVFAEGSRRV